MSKSHGNTWKGAVQTSPLRKERYKSHLFLHSIPDSLLYVVDEKAKREVADSAAHVCNLQIYR